MPDDAECIPVMHKSCNLSLLDLAPLAGARLRATTPSNVLTDTSDSYKNLHYASCLASEGYLTEASSHCSKQTLLF